MQIVEEKWVHRCWDGLANTKSECPLHTDKHAHLLSCANGLNELTPCHCGVISIAQEYFTRPLRYSKFKKKIRCGRKWSHMPSASSFSLIVLKLTLMYTSHMCPALYLFFLYSVKSNLMSLFNIYSIRPFRLQRAKLHYFPKQFLFWYFNKFCICRINSHGGQNIVRLVEIWTCINASIVSTQCDCSGQKLVAWQSCFTWFQLHNTTNAAFDMGNVNIKAYARGFAVQLLCLRTLFTYSTQNNCVNVFLLEAWTHCLFVQWSIRILCTELLARLIWQRQGALLAGK